MKNVYGDVAMDFKRKLKNYILLNIILYGDEMKINKSSLKLVNVEYEEYIQWAINNHLKPYDKSTFELFFKLIRTNELVRDKYTKKLRKRQSKGE